MYQVEEFRVSNPKEGSMKETAIFIDNQNHCRSLSSVIAYNAGETKSLEVEAQYCWTDWKNFKKKHHITGCWTRTYDSTSVTEGTIKLTAMLKKFGIDFVNLPKVHSGKQAGVDIRIARDMMALDPNKYGKIVLYSGDSDFADTIKQLVSRGIEVEVRGFKHTLSPALSSVASSVFDLTPVAECIGSNKNTFSLDMDIFGNKIFMNQEGPKEVQKKMAEAISQEPLDFSAGKAKTREGIATLIRETKARHLKELEPLELELLEIEEAERIAQAQAEAEERELEELKEFKAWKALKAKAELEDKAKANSKITRLSKRGE